MSADMHTCSESWMTSSPTRAGIHGLGLPRQCFFSEILLIASSVVALNCFAFYVHVVDVHPIV